jgi:hypothetical protein
VNVLIFNCKEFTLQIGDRENNVRHPTDASFSWKISVFLQSGLYLAVSCC